MIITHHNNHIFPYVTIENTYDRSELKLIWEELEFLCNKRVFDDTRPATDIFGKILSNNLSLFVDDIYNNRKTSNLLTINRKLFNNFNKIIHAHPHWYFKNFDCGQDSTLLSYYENNHYYDYHVDNAYLTSLTWFYKNPKAFTGGDLLLNVDDNEIQINVEDNFTIIFPSFIKHKVTEVSLDEKFSFKKMGRFCMTQFMKPPG